MPHLQVNFANEREAEADTYGVELGLRWQATQTWQLHAAYGYLEIDAGSSGSPLTPAEVVSIEDRDPHHIASVRSLWNVTPEVELDLQARYVDRISGINTDSYLTLDSRIGWRPNKTLEIALVGTSLVDDPVEFGTYEANRIVYGRVTLHLP